MEEERITTGVDELDRMLGGGLLPKSLVVVVGPEGGGKTIITLHFIYANLKRGKRCLFISASDEPEMVIKNSLKFGWNLEPYVKSGQLKLVVMRLIDSEQGIARNLLHQIPETVKSSGAEMAVIDSITEFLDLCDTDVERRGRLMEIRWILRDVGATALLTAEASTGGHTSKYGLAEYVSDGVIQVSRFESEDLSAFLYVLRITKMRWTRHSKEIRAYEITDKGIDIRTPLYTALAATAKKREQ